MPLVGGADLNGTASGDPTDLRFNRLYKASPTVLTSCKLYGQISFFQAEGKACGRFKRYAHAGIYSVRMHGQSVAFRFAEDVRKQYYGGERAAAIVSGTSYP
eukprot:5766581-Pleurochrysis_carterae.AAC.2